MDASPNVQVGTTRSIMLCLPGRNPLPARSGPSVVNRLRLLRGNRKAFECPQTLLNQARDREMRVVQPELVDLLTGRFHNAGLALG
jgi:hypothetical protein